MFRRSLAWAETETATGNPWVVDFGGRVRRNETSGLESQHQAMTLAAWNWLFFFVAHLTRTLVLKVDLASNARSNRSSDDIQHSLWQLGINVDYSHCLSARRVAGYLHARNIDALLPQHIAE